MSGTAGKVLEDHLADFAGLLRREGVPVGTAELLDALRALQALDLSSRSSFKAALQATLIKSYRHQGTFDHLFDRYFIPPEAQRKIVREEQIKQRQLQKKLEEADSTLRFKGQQIKLTDAERKIYSSLPEEQKQSLNRFVAETESGKKVEERFLPLLESVVKGHLRYWHRRRDDKNPSGSGFGEGVGSGEPTGDRLRHINMKDIREADLPAAEALLYRLSQQLAKKLQRRRRNSAGRGPLDVRRTLRENMRYGGALFKLEYKSRYRNKQELLVICDVSASMQRYSSFVLQFIYGLQSVVKNLESFLFADSLEHISPSIKRGDSLEQVMNRVVVNSKTWGGGTNLAVSLEAMLERHGQLLNSRTAVIIVSDTRTITLDSALQTLMQLKEKVREIVWLNPLPLDEWALHRSVELFERVVEMWPCYTIAQLEQVITGRLLHKPAQAKKETGGITHDSSYRRGR